MPSTLLNALVQEEKARQIKSNPFLTLSESLKGGIPYVPEADWRLNLATGLLGPLAQGAFNAIGDNQVSSSMAEFGDQLKDFSATGELGPRLERYGPDIEMDKLIRGIQLEDQKKLIDARYESLFGASTPETEDLFQAMISGKATKEQEARLQSLDPRKYREARMRIGQIDTKERADRTYEGKLAKERVPGFTTISGDIRLGEKKAGELRGKNAALSSLLGKYDFAASQPANEFWGTMASVTAAMQGSQFNDFRILTNSGARLEGREAKILQAMVASNFRGNPLDWAKRVGLGEDPREFARVMKSLTKKAHYVSLLHEGIISPIEGFSYYPLPALTSVAPSSPIIQNYLNKYLDKGEFEALDPKTLNGQQNLRALEKYQVWRESQGDYQHE